MPPSTRHSRCRGPLAEAALDAVLVSVAEGYSFPTNLDRDPPVGGLAPETQKTLLRKALLSGGSEDRFLDDLRRMDERRMP